MLNIKQNYAWKFFRFLVRPGSLFMHDVAEVFAFFVYLQDTRINWDPTWPLNSKQNYIYYRLIILFFILIKKVSLNYNLSHRGGKLFLLINKKIMSVVDSIFSIKGIKSYQFNIIVKILWNLLNPKRTYPSKNRND